MAFADQPAPQGATKIDHRAGENKPYVYQPYPGFRYHPELGSQIVRNEEQDKVLGPPWRDTPYPVKPIAAPVPEPTVAELKARVIALEAENAALKIENESARMAVTDQMREAEVKASKTEGKRQAAKAKAE